MQAEHKKALVVIFAALFTCLFIGAMFITFYTHNLAISGLLITVLVVLAIDIFWVIRDKEDATAT